MIALLDINVLVALFDGAHIGHEEAHAWFGQHRGRGHVWATCPMTENGLVRVLSNPSYPGRRTTVGDAIRRLETFRASGGHAFWPDAVSLCDNSLIHPRRVKGHRQLTDVYLLALAVHHGGCLATFDRRISPAAVTGATSEHLALLGV